MLRSQNDDPVYRPLIGFLECPDQVEATQEIRDVLRDAGTYSLDIITGLLVYSYHHYGKDTRVPVLLHFVYLL